VFVALPRLMSELSTFPDRLIVPPRLDVTLRLAAPAFPAASRAVTTI
jgi:hypothetical protein